MPRHALFHVRVTIHQLASVPLVKGEFGARWKFKKVKARKGSLKQDKGKRKKEDGQSDTDGEEEHEGEEDLDDEPPSPNSGRNSTVPHLVVSDGTRSKTMSANSSPPRPSTGPYAHYLSSDWLPQTFLSHTHSRTNLPETGAHQEHQSLSATTPVDGYAHARGMTPYLKLQDHSVSWEHTLNVVVQMDVKRDTLDLLPNELKLVVMQVSGYLMFVRVGILIALFLACHSRRH